MASSSLWLAVLGAGFGSIGFISALVSGFFAVHTNRRAVGRLKELEGLQEQLGSQKKQVTILRDQIGEFETANKAAEDQHGQLSEEIRRLELLRSSLLRQVQQLQEKPFVVVRHTVFLDGKSQGGKTTFVERVVNPLATAASLAEGSPSVGATRVAPLPICFEDTGATVRLHILQFVDIPGERPETFLDMLDDHSLRWEPLKHASGVTEEKGSAAVVMVWDVLATPEQNHHYMNETRVQVTYGSRRATEVIRGHAIFLNKCDAVRAQRPGLDAEPHLAGRLSEHEKFIGSKVMFKIQEYYPQPIFVRGSALTGEGVHVCLGEVYRLLGLDGLFPSARAKEAGGRH